jgi:hypothetical protein
MCEKDRLGGGSVMEYVQGCIALNREMSQWLQFIAKYGAINKTLNTSIITDIIF